MDIYWQITVIQLLQNVAVFAVAVIAFGLVRQLTVRWKTVSKCCSDPVTGVVLGTATAITLLLPVHISGGASTGSETILLALAGVIASPIAAAIAAVFAAAAQLVPLIHGDAIDRLGLAMSLAAAATGVAFRYLLLWRSSERRACYFHFPILGLASATTSLAVLWQFQGESAVAASALGAVMSSVAASTVLGTLLLHEIRRRETEKDLRESEANLAAQARELSKARDEAEAASKAKSAFLANMSHELRTPLNAILGFSELISQESLGPVGSSRYKEYANDIHNSGAHLLSLINELLDVAKIEAGKMEIVTRSIDAYRTFDSALKLVGTKARERQQTLEVTIAPNTPPLFADERAIKQILINLVSNAIKFTQEGGRISVRAGMADDGGFQIVCEDNGPGIPREKLQHIFTPFSQIDNRFERQAGGTGLGLTLVRGLVELHGGHVWLDSEYGMGCRATVVLPSKPPSTRPIAA